MEKSQADLKLSASYKAFQVGVGIRVSSCPSCLRPNEPVSPFQQKETQQFLTDTETSTSISPVVPTALRGHWRRVIFTPFPGGPEARPAGGPQSHHLQHWAATPCPPFLVHSPF